LGCRFSGNVDGRYVPRVVQSIAGRLTRLFASPLFGTISWELLGTTKLAAAGTQSITTRTDRTSEKQCPLSDVAAAEKGEDEQEESTAVRWFIALVLTLLTTALSLVIMAITGVGGLFLWPSIILLSIGLGLLCRRSPLARVAYGFPFAGLLAGRAFELQFSPSRSPDSVGSLMITLLALSLALWAIYTGYLRAISGGVVRTAGSRKAHEIGRAK
jgi:hypothetical protein